MTESWPQHETRCAHRRKIFCMDWSCDGTLLASGSQDHSIKIWKVGGKGTSLSSESELKGHEDSVMYLRWHPVSPDRIASISGQEQNLRFWDARASRNTATLSTPGNNLYLAWSGDGNYVALGNRNDVVCMVDVRKMSIVQKVAYKYQVNELKFMKDSNYLLQGTGNDCRLEIVRVEDMKVVNAVKGHTAGVLSVGVDIQGQYIATGGSDAMTCLWDAQELICVKSYYCMDNPARSLSFSHDSKYLTMTGEDTCVYVENVKEGTSLGTIELRSVPEETSWSPKANILAYAVDSYDYCNIVLRNAP